MVYAVAKFVKSGRDGTRVELSIAQWVEGVPANSHEQRNLALQWAIEAGFSLEAMRWWDITLTRVP